MKRHGPAPRPLALRFWDKVNNNGPVVRPEFGQCWVWMGAISGGTGYGGIARNDGRKVSAHRASWELAHGPIPVGHDVCHRCDNKICVRPDHLFVGTRQDNVDDAVAKGRQSRGHGDRIQRSSVGDTRNTSGFRGVRLDRRRHRWQAALGRRFLGYFPTAVGAAVAYDRAAVSRFGQRAFQNFRIDPRTVAMVKAFAEVRA